MPEQKVILIGAGGHAASVSDSANMAGIQIVGYVDEVKTGRYLGRTIFKRIEDIPDYRSYLYHIAIGSCEARARWYKYIKQLGLPFINIIDPSAIVADSALIGNGNFIGKFTTIIAGSVIGDNNIINTKALIEHECRVGNHVNLSTCSILNGDVVVEDKVFLGSAALCNGQIKLGEGCIVGSGSVVLHDVDAHSKVVGVPARVIERGAQPI